MNQPWGQFQKNPIGSRSRLAGPPQIDPNAPIRSRGSISQHQPNFFGRIEKKISDSPFLVSIAFKAFYNTVDAMYIFLSLQKGRRKRDLSGELMSGTEINDRMIDYLSSVIGKFPQFIMVRGLNAAQFGSHFKGTFLTRLNPKQRGLVNRAYNNITTNSGIPFNLILWEHLSFFLLTTKNPNYINNNIDGWLNWRCYI